MNVDQYKKSYILLDKHGQLSVVEGRDYQTDALILAMLFFANHPASNKAPMYNKDQIVLQIFKTTSPNTFWIQRLTEHVISGKNYQDPDTIKYSSVEGNGMFISLTENNIKFKLYRGAVKDSPLIEEGYFSDPTHINVYGLKKCRTNVSSRKRKGRSRKDKCPK